MISIEYEMLKGSNTHRQIDKWNAMKDLQFATKNFSSFVKNAMESRIPFLAFLRPLNVSKCYFCNVRRV